MPAGDPAGYLPNVLKARKRRKLPAYQPRKGTKLTPAVKPRPKIVPPGFKPAKPRLPKSGDNAPRRYFARKGVSK